MAKKLARKSRPDASGDDRASLDRREAAIRKRYAVRRKEAGDDPNALRKIDAAEMRALQPVFRAMREARAAELHAESAGHPPTPSLRALRDMLDRLDPDLPGRIRALSPTGQDPDDAWEREAAWAWDYALRLREVDPALPPLPNPSVGKGVDLIRSLRQWRIDAERANDAGTNGQYRPATWFPSGMADRLRQAASKNRKTKRVATRTVDGVVCYSVADSRRWWPSDVPKET